jgi:arylsulfatase A-like enzyme
MAWPVRIKDAGGIRNQSHHVIDIVPTILEAARLPEPVMVNGIAQKPIEGVSMAYTWDTADANAPGRRTTQYFEMFGSRALYQDGWIASAPPIVAPWAITLAPPNALRSRIQKEPKPFDREFPDVVDMTTTRRRVDPVCMGYRIDPRPHAAPPWA